MSKEAMSLALEALKQDVRMAGGWTSSGEYKAIKALEEALAKQEQGEPVAWIYESVCGNDFTTRNKPPTYAKNIRPLYTTPQQCKPLTLEQIREHWQVAKVLDMTDAEIDFADYVLIARDVEALYGIKE